MGRTSDAKEKLLDVAFHLIWDSSYGGVSVDQICAQAGVNKGSFYHFFGSKADLAVAAYEEHWKQRQPELDRMFSAQVPPLERLVGGAGAPTNGRRKGRKFGHVCGCPYASIGVEVATQDDKIRAKAEELIARGTKYVESAIAEAQREGSVPVSDDARRLAQQVYSFVLGALLRAKIQNDVEVLRDLAPTVMAIIGAKSEAGLAA